MKVLIFSLQYYPLVGGAEIAIKEITDRIPDIEFHLVTLRFDRAQALEERIGNVFVHRVGRGRRGLTYEDSFSPGVYLSKIFFVPLAVRRARELHAEHHFDLLWAMMSYMLFPIVLLRRRGIKVPYLLTLQEGDPFERVFNRPHILPFRPLLKAGFREAAAVQAISTFLADWAKHAGFKGKPVVVGNGVDLARFSHTYPSEVLRKTRAQFSSTPGGTLLVTTSRLVAKNAVDDVIRALASLPASIQFVVYGIGPEEGALRLLAKAKGVESRVHFMGQITHEALPLALHACDIFIRPSRSEGMGNSFIEAMAAGLPVIATQEGGIRDFLFDAKRNPDKEPTGWAVDKDSPEQVAQAVQDILAHGEQVARTVANAKKLVTENYDWDLIAKRMRALFDRVCGASTMGA